MPDAPSDDAGEALSGVGGAKVVVRPSDGSGPREVQGVRVVTVELGYTPPSLNKVGAAQNWRVFHRHKSTLQNDIESMLLVPLGAGFRLERVEAEATLRFPSRRRRDEGNYRVLLEKALGDALTGDVKAWPEGRWLVDDTPEHFTFGAVVFEVGPSSTELRLSCTPAQPRQVG